jgi:hypothetical protein
VSPTVQGDVVTCLPLPSGDEDGGIPAMWPDGIVSLDGGLYPAARAATGRVNAMVAVGRVAGNS